MSPFGGKTLGVKGPRPYRCAVIASGRAGLATIRPLRCRWRIVRSDYFSSFGKTCDRRPLPGPRYHFVGVPELILRRVGAPSVPSAAG